MKTISLLAIVTLTLAIAPARSQSDHPCGKLLVNGLYNEYKMTNTGNFSQDFKTYLFSDQFRSDLKNGKWGGSITVPIEGVPVTLGANASDQEVTQFRERISKATEFSVREEHYQTIFSSIPNVELAKTYAKCVIEFEKLHTTGFHIEGTSGSDWVTFDVRYNPAVSTDPMPKVVQFDVLNGTNVKTALTKGKSISNSNLVNCRRDPKQDVVFFLETDRGTATYKVAAQPPVEISRDMPVGTIVASYLSVDQFYVASKSNENSPGGIWTAEKSLWCPCDGRAVPGSLFLKIASQDRVPDVRGLFLRSVNVMEPTPQVPLNDSHKDPESRSVGSFQTDDIKSHSHETNTGFWPGGPNGPGRVVNQAMFQNGVGQVSYATPSGGARAETTTQFGGPETHPKNLAVFYYIRIN